MNECSYTNKDICNYPESGFSFSFLFFIIIIFLLTGCFYYSASGDGDVKKGCISKSDVCSTFDKNVDACLEANNGVTGGIY
jgi:hypothetical protein